VKAQRAESCQHGSDRIKSATHPMISYELEGSRFSSESTIDALDAAAAKD
jgi:hypothetical protein